jgi:GH15 family glucan-1,4-alpha-glucosidase
MQFQLDVYGEVADALHETRRVGIPPDPESRNLELALLDYLESAWREPDEGIWEVRGPRRHFTHSRVMAWVAFDRAVQAVTDFGQDGPLERWSARRDEIHDEVCREGFDAQRGTFTQFYGSSQLDAAALMIPLVGFLPASDARVQGTVAAVERELTDHRGLVRRYSDDGSESVDGLPRGEGAFLPCAFWLADNHALAGRWRRARELFDQLSGYANDVGLLSEEVDPDTGHLLGNFPQAFSHVSLINSARNLSHGAAGPAARRNQAAGQHRRRRA